MTITFTIINQINVYETTYHYISILNDANGFYNVYHTNEYDYLHHKYKKLKENYYEILEDYFN